MTQKSEADTLTVPSGQWPLYILCSTYTSKKNKLSCWGGKILVYAYQTGKLHIWKPIYYNCYEINYRYIK